MSQSTEPDDEGSETLKLDALIADILAKKASVFDLLRSSPSGDYWAFVQQVRLFHVLAREPRVLEHLMAELRVKIAEAGGAPDDEAIATELARKDGSRRFRKLVEERSQARKAGASLLSGTTFEACLEQYKTLIAHVEKLWADACQRYMLGDFPLATFLAILVIEEIAKLADLAEDLIFYDVRRAAAQVSAVEKSHRRKHFIGVVSGALINARLDRVLGKDTIRKILHQAESDELEKLRQRCIYIDVEGGRAVTPGERVDGELARALTVLGGELMAEVLGYFPWDFERMLDNVIAFEREIGIPEKKINRR